MQREPLRDLARPARDLPHRGSRRSACLASARVHLAASSGNGTGSRASGNGSTHSASPGQRAHRLPADLPPGTCGLDLDIAGAIAWLQDYAERSNWSAIEKEAAARLDLGWLERHPWPMIVGSASFPNRLKSPAWELLAFAAPAGFDSKALFGVIVHNADDAPVATHAIVCDPRSHLIVEAWERSSDHVWHERRYGFVSRGTVERLRGPFALANAEEVVTHADLDTLKEPLNSLAPLLRDAASTFD